MIEFKCITEGIKINSGKNVEVRWKGSTIPFRILKKKFFKQYGVEFYLSSSWHMALGRRYFLREELW